MTQSLVVVPILLVAACTASLLMRWFGPAAEAGKFVCIDGLRGYLSLLVFVHHAALWFAVSQGHPWGQGQTRFLTNVGPVAVTLFFMITGFLFIRKVASSTSSVAWGEMYTHRLFRLAPLYLVAVVAIACIALSVAPGTEPPLTIAAELLAWSAFGVFGQPPIARFVQTSQISASVVWTLTVEWFFYLVLPTIAVGLGRPTPPRILLITVALAAFVVFESADVGWLSWTYGVDPFIGFVGGPIALYLSGKATMHRLARSAVGSVVTIALVVAAFRLPGGVPQVLLLSVAFSMIACGCSVFGLLTRPWSLFMGQGGYGMYLFHGILLYLVFGLTTRTLAAGWHWAIVVAITPLLVLGSTLAFVAIERPGIRAGRSAGRWLWGRSRSNESAAASPPRTP